MELSTMVYNSKSGAEWGKMVHKCPYFLKKVPFRQTDIRTQVTYHPHGRVFLMCYSQWYEGTFYSTNFSYV